MARMVPEGVVRKIPGCKQIAGQKALARSLPDSFCCLRYPDAIRFHNATANALYALQSVVVQRHSATPACYCCLPESGRLLTRQKSDRPVAVTPQDIAQRGGAGWQRYRGYEAAKNLSHHVPIVDRLPQIAAAVE